ncbi:MAG: TetR/AcrR family transcriptional regulator [Rhizomicrobium sp.]|jgi:AcrR family transcriptional regulator
MAKSAGALEKVGRSAEERGGENKGERTRARIRSAFCELLAHKSFAAITISDICRTADITVGGFYFHFPNQDALLDEVIGEYGDDLGVALDAAMAVKGTDQARSICAALVCAYQDCNGLARTFQQLRRTRSEYAARWRAITDPRIVRLAAILARERPDLSAPKAAFLAHALITMVVSQLDLTFVYDRSRTLTTATALTKNLTLLWRRMAECPSP